jgi:predicted TIM-barrel fold metal-dependent hydrolase
MLLFYFKLVEKAVELAGQLMYEYSRPVLAGLGRKQMENGAYEIIDAHVHTNEHMAGYGCRGELRMLGNGRGRWATGEEMRLLADGMGANAFPHESLISLLDAHGVSKAVMMQGSLNGFCNDYVHEAQEAHKGRLFGMGTFDPYAAQAGKIMRRVIEDFHFLGFKFEMSESYGFMGYHPDFRLDGELMRPVLEYAEEKQLAVSLDMGTFGERSMQVKELSQIAQRYPGIRFVAEHMFYPGRDHYDDVWNALEALEERENISFTVASIPNSTMPEAYPYPLACRYLMITKNVVGTKRIMWGSDAPGVLISAPYGELINYIACSGLFDAQELRDIYSENAKRVYGI